MMRTKPRRRLMMGMALCLFGAATAGLEAAEPPSVPGMVRHTEIRIAPELSGRLAQVPVKPGQAVRKGELLAVIDTPELTASLGEARAAAASAAAERARVESGVRAEEVAILAEAVRTANANLLLARERQSRVAALAAKGFSSPQDLDEANASLAKAEAEVALKTAQHAAAQAGPTREERALAGARVALAGARVAEIETQLAKTRLLAPADGTVGVQVAEIGEILAPGRPVMTLARQDAPWFSFTIREDRLDGLTVGTAVELRLADGRTLPARVTVLRPLGEFATWRAARAVGDHDLNSFRLRVDPLAGLEGLEPGMTVWLAAKP